MLLIKLKQSGYTGVSNLAFSRASSPNTENTSQQEWHGNMNVKSAKSADGSISQSSHERYWTFCLPPKLIALP